MNVSRWLNVFRNPSPSTSSRASRRWRRLAMESLEDRHMLSVATSYVSNDWEFVTDSDSNSALSQGDQVRIGASGDLRTYGVDAFGVVATGAPEGVNASLPDFDNVQDAIDNTDANGTVNVLAGTYEEDLSITTDGLHLVGAGIGVSTIKGVATNAVGDFPLATPNIDVQANDVQLTALTIQTPTVASGQYASGIVLSGTNIEITGNAFVASNGNGAPNSATEGSGSNDSNTNIFIQTYRDTAKADSNVDGLQITNNTFAGGNDKGYYGVFINHQGAAVNADVTVSGNTFTGNIWRGISTERDQTRILNNKITTDTDRSLGWTGSGVMVADYNSRDIDDVTIRGNTITGASASAGFFEGVRIGFTGVTAAYTNILVDQNFSTRNSYNLRVNDSADGVTVQDNDLSGASMKSADNLDGGATLNASSNWWGSNVESTVSASVSGLVDFSPYLDNGNDTDTDATTGPGFQGDLSALDVTLLGEHTAGVDRIAEAFAALATPGVVLANPGAYGVDVSVPADTTFSGGVTSTVDINNLALDSMASLGAQFNGTNANEFTQFNVTGGVNLNGAAFSAAFGFTPAKGDSFVIINNDDTDGVTGEFANWAQGTTKEVGGVPLTINYAGGDGNDVEVTVADPSISFFGLNSDGALHKNEGADGVTTDFVFTVRLSNATTQTVTVDFATADGVADVANGIGAATSATGTIGGGDYDALSDTLTFMPGETEKTITVHVNGDNILELTRENFFVNLTNPTNAILTGGTSQLQAIGSIQNDDAQVFAGITSTTSDTAEGDSGQKTFTFDVTLTGQVDAAVTMTFGTEDGAVTAGNPIVTLMTNFGAIPIELFLDHIPPELIVGSPFTSVVDVVNNFLNYVNHDDYINSFFHRHSSVAGSGVEVLQTGGYTTSSDTFSDVSQFTGITGNAPVNDATGLSNVRGTIGLATKGPNTGTSEFYINLIDNTNLDGNYTVFGRVLDMTAVDAIAGLTVSDLEPSNQNSPYHTVPLSGSNELAVIKSTSVAMGGDYLPISGQTVTFQPGETTKSVSVQVLGDTLVEADEMFNGVLSTLSANSRNVVFPGGVGNNSTTSATATITNDDSATVSLTGGGSHNEGDQNATPFPFTLTLSNPVDVPVVVQIGAVDGTATAADHDFLPIQDVTIPAGRTTWTFNVNVKGDMKVETDESFNVELAADGASAPGRSVTATASSHLVTITNDDQSLGVVGRTATGQWWIGHNNGTSLVNMPFGAWDESAGWLDVMTGDFNGDGQTDVIGRTSGGDWWLGQNNGSTFDSILYGHWDETAGWQDVLSGDFDGDGATDIVGRTSGGVWWLARNNGSGFTNIHFGGWFEDVGWIDVLAIDVNQDGVTDIMGRTVAGGGQWWLSQFTGGLGNSKPYGGWDLLGFRDVMVTDFDQDGDTDIVGRTETGRWWLARNDGTVFHNESIGSWDESANWQDVALGDFDGDGAPDIIGRTAGGTWWLTQFDGVALASHVYGVWDPTQDWRDVTVADFDNDGDADVLGRASNGLWWLGRNNGTEFESEVYGAWDESLDWRDVDTADA